MYNIMVAVMAHGAIQFYNRNTVSLGIEINRDCKKKSHDKIHNPFYISIPLFSFIHREFIA